MNDGIESEIAELTTVHRGLVRTVHRECELILSGSLTFEAVADGFDAITDSFDIELTIGERYQEVLPAVRETGGRIECTYEHIYENGTLCLAVPIEERRIFWEQPTLLGFVNRLVVPYLYSYCHWKRTGLYPFGEQAHGSEGIVQHYLESTDLPDEISVLAALSFLFEHGYRGHHRCPCESGIKVRNCHGLLLRALHNQHTDLTLQHDFISVLDTCLAKIKDGTLSLPDGLQRQVLRILKKKKL